MHLTNPTWVHHEGGAIYSVDIHPTMDKLATCGQGDVGGCGLVIIWNLRPIQSERAYADTTCHKILARIQHQAGVNCVRWSHDGDLLACASDDKVITIYEYGGRVQSAGSIGSKSVVNVEKYRLSHTLHTHSMEVLSVEWSSDGRYLASASMDNTVVVWNAKKLPERIVVLDAARGGHNGPVKGLSWDPIGKYLATQSADKSLRLWTTDNWQCDTVITKPFSQSSQTTMFSRLDWSPDGQFSLRPEWDTELDLVGHRRAVTAIRVCPSLLSYVDYSGKTIQVTCIAIGSRDKSLSVWVLPRVKRPIVVLQRLFKHSVTDMSWRGTDLVVSSQDGSIKYLSFREKELGTMLSPQKMTLHQRRIRSLIQPEELMATRKAEAAVPKESAKAAESVTSTQRAASKALTEQRQQQMEVRTSDGKRRIQPIFLGSTVDEEPAPPPPPPPSHLKSQASSQVDEAMPSDSDDARDKSPSKSVARLASTDDSMVESTDDDVDSSDVDASAKADKEAANLEELSKRTKMMMADFKKPMLRPVDSIRIDVTQANAVLDVPEQRATISEGVQGVLGDTIEVDNDWVMGGVRASHVSYLHSRTPVWSVEIAPTVAVVVANRFWTVIGCYDRSVFVYSSTNGKVHFRNQLDSAPVRMGINGHKMYVLTQTGHLSTWDIDKIKAILSRQSITDCVVKDANLMSISVTSTGIPLLGFSTGNIFTFSLDMNCWQIVDSMSPLMKLCDSIDADELPDGPVGKLLKRRKRPGLLPSIPRGVSSSVKESLLEGWLLAAKTTGSPTDFRGLLMSYVQQLVRNRSLSKLADVLHDLSEPGSICGVQRGALRADLERIVASDPITSSLLTSMDSNSMVF
uniref:Protein HIRA n=1 Tax=Haemonchus contortus TaxID=6289 RepID=A0A7I4Y9D9_HAECO